LIAVQSSRQFNHNGRAKNPGASWEEYGSPNSDFCGAPGTKKFCGGILRGLAPQAVVPQKAPQKEPSGLGFWFLVCCAATQLATQLQQRCIKVVCSNKEARKRLTESNGTPAMDLGHMDVVLK